ncbi:MAG: dicarboxylate/amino acid:cation symporter [Azospirillaceae bacterium]
MSDIAASSGQLHQQRFRLRVWIRTRLWAQVIAGMVLGIAAGSLLGPDLGLVDPIDAEWIGAWLALPGDLFLGLIAMVLIPLIMASIIQGLTGTEDTQVLKSVGVQFLVFVVLTTTAAALIGLTLADLLNPGVYVAPATPVYPDPATIPAPRAELPFAQAPAAISGLLPTNPSAAMLERDMLAVVIFALLIGLACTQARRERVQPILDLFGAMLTVSMIIVQWAMFIVPLAVFGLMAKLVIDVGFATLIGMSIYVVTVLAGLLVLLIVYLALIAAFGGIGPAAFIRAAFPTLLLAFSTSSSSAVMPMSIDTAIKRLGVPERIANLVVPLGATVNMAGTALYQTTAIVFLAQVAGLELSAGDLTMIIFTLVAASIGAPGTPGVSVAILTTVAASYGIPAAGMVMILGVDRILDMSRTFVNVAGDLTACALLRHAGGEPVVTGAQPS